MSTTSSASIFWSRSSSRRFVASVKDKAIAAFASTMIFPKDAFSSGESVPRFREAPAIGDLSPECNKRALFNSSRFVADEKAVVAASIHP